MTPEAEFWPGKFCLGCGAPIPRTRRFDSLYDDVKCKNRELQRRIKIRKGEQK